MFLDLDECQSSPCLNRGHCINLVNEYNCVCQPGYSGASCELGMFTYIFLRKRPSSRICVFILNMVWYCLQILMSVLWESVTMRLPVWTLMVHFSVPVVQVGREIPVRKVIYFSWRFYYVMTCLKVKINEFSLKDIYLMSVFNYYIFYLKRYQRVHFE